MDPSEPPPKVKKRERTPTEVAKERKAKSRSNHGRNKRSRTRRKSRKVRMDRDTYKQWCSAAGALGLTPSEFSTVLLQTALHSMPRTTANGRGHDGVTSMDNASPSEDHGLPACTCLCTCGKVKTGRMEKHKSTWVHLQELARAAGKSHKASSKSNFQSESDGKNKAGGKHVQKGDENEIDQSSPPHRQLQSRSKVKYQSNRMHLQEENGAAADLASLQSGLEKKNKGRDTCKLDQNRDKNEMEHSSTRHTCRQLGSQSKAKYKRTVTPMQEAAVDSPVVDTNLSSTWSYELKPTYVPEFEGPSPGPTTTMTAKHREIDFFHLLFPPYLIRSLVMQTNKFADSLVSNWTHISLVEMQIFIGLRVLMSILNFPDRSMYWSSDDLLQKIITQKRFHQISQYFSETFSDSSTTTGGGEGQGKPYNLHMVFENVNHNFRVRYNPHRNCVLTEAGSLEREDREDRNQFWMRVDPFNGYCSEFQMCDSTEKAALDRIVFSLTRVLQKQNYIVNIGHQFTNGDLLMALQEKGIFGRGEIAKSSKVFQSCSVTNHLSQDVLQQGSLTAYQWQDQDRKLQVISSADNPLDTCRVRKTFQDHCYTAPCPVAVMSYMDHMGSIQSPLQLHKTIISSHLSLDGWVHMFWFTMDVAIANALVLMKESAAHSEVSKGLSSLQFRKNLAKQLIWDHIQNGESLDHEQIKECDHEQCEHSGCTCTSCWL